MQTDAANPEILVYCAGGRQVKTAWRNLGVPKPEYAKHLRPYGKGQFWGKVRQQDILEERHRPIKKSKRGAKTKRHFEQARIAAYKEYLQWRRWATNEPLGRSYKYWAEQLECKWGFKNGKMNPAA